ncbi:hypothetical protein EaACW_3278 [Erwinia amylovora ACW56400]|uniref:Uncharacterized protein n=2 Tax=Erwinia amylovora TaxID=552 RepID=A0A831A277_ERWAM|nr:hypothetical protein EaACW_3278 [Erwinia amylovora ACW56400]CBA23316.1 hypothetical protein predicted by Glimmer/Critica [Erwinia amylovora CFBP1430]CCO80117.1 hypothetical protein BN432_3347 [Erwinia amylovora Ea356]CCO83921.1 hypothetical protein BN433_3373 [Erwinia amylovora Ea266]CCO87683.1 hypothetical protein BN434_3323 [Erwinia amylovora CFBP 2585]CCO91474.1 hypothetical protein BN435_3331 [Erwinia amylovora 01SFR-BO]CCO95269.1 hypothetical protein BN437_3368 [Erwinia amylovora NBRC
MFLPMIDISLSGNFNRHGCSAHTFHFCLKNVLGE